MRTHDIRCPNCGTIAATIQQPQGEVDDLSTRVSSWLATLDWEGGRRGSRELFERYQQDTGDTITSHRRWSLAMQAIGETKTRTTKGRRVFAR